ncbi:MAG: MBL fold metallo-hydrolase [Gammaproteobacteria bacterium]|nr:MBL fold metallo-hydrolase [Gammaproteobacteria bacterium]MCW8839726.1 MBL fold metallo-hydrolase [Gammaproteobacteria bacterium]MCW8959087.1 MBL fold metallo-hydrolase [Gammaproteobacteria bacterium]MCW8994156.1 MBL fold metallo-hydrolase [Gammaproteobacteria bacterium]
MLDKTKSAMAPQQLWDGLLRDEPLFILDVRNHDEFESWRVEGPHPVTTLNVPYFELLELEGEDEDVTRAVRQGVKRQLEGQLPRDLLILAVCAEGHTSFHVAEGLRQLGYEAVNMEGGMVAWGNFYYSGTLEQNDRFTLYQMVRPARGCVSHILISGTHAAVFDPARHIEHYQQLAADHGAKIEWVLDTHLHADHLSGGPGLGEQQRAPYFLHPYDAIHPMDMLPARIAYRPLEDGQTLSVGEIPVEVLHYPGHTLGMVAFLIDGHYLLSGDSLFIESIARPDLGGKAEAWTPLLYDSLRRMAALPDDLIVLPAHFSDLGIADEQGLFHARLGDLKRRNPGLRKLAEGEQAFTDYILANLPTFPPAYVEIKRANAGLAEVDERKAQELELGKNICALGK